MEVTLLGMDTDSRLLQYWKAPLPMEVTLLGIDTLFRPEKWEKTPPLIAVTLLGMTRSVILVPFTHNCPV